MLHFGPLSACRLLLVFATGYLGYRLLPGNEYRFPILARCGTRRENSFAYLPHAEISLTQRSTVRLTNMSHFSAEADVQ